MSFAAQTVRSPCKEIVYIRPARMDRKPMQRNLMQSLDRILDRFEKVSAIPRGTKQESQIRQWLRDWATELGLANQVDSVGNLVIYVPASPGFEGRPPLILQGHLDMVWQKTPDSDHDFTRDPIRVLRDSDWLKADRTTLGADNGIAIALMMALAEEATASHPPLELLLTVEEEVGIGGADFLDPELLTAKTLINLDSEEDGVFTVGCAGGGSVLIHLPVTWESASPDMEFFLLKVSGLQGGHSGGDINKQRANANKVLARTLDFIQVKVPLQLAALKGGSARNAIPRDAQAAFACPKGQSAVCREQVERFAETLASEYSKTEASLALSVEQANSSERIVSLVDSQTAVRLLLALPNGVAEMSAEVEGFVETSSNVGVVELLEDGLHVISNHRSSVSSRLEEINRRVEAIAQFAGAQTSRTKIYAPWQPDLDSPLLKKCEAVYEAQFGHQPEVHLTHGGLECGIISDRCGGLDTISLGPTILNPHSPDERLYIPSVANVWQLLTALLAAE